MDPLGLYENKASNILMSFIHEMNLSNKDGSAYKSLSSVGQFYGSLVYGDIHASYQGSILQQVEGRGAAETITKGALVVSFGAAITAIVANAAVGTKAAEEMGKAFDPDGPAYQPGVDPNTITPGKDLSKLKKGNLENAEKYYGDNAVDVYKNGTVEDGNHRLKNARDGKRAIDVFKKPY